jgi:hypothetical protein
MRQAKSSKAMESQKVYQDLQKAILSLGYARPGSLVRRYMPCGRPTCRCMGKPPELHGPYYQWTHKIRGKTITLRLSEAQAERCAEWVDNHRQLKKLLRRMEALSLKETDRILGAIS